ncbi:MAG: flagellar motor switch protein FliM, partial [Nitrospinae bacterium]|nr:flagellar motor switch protein FliM [Nitrospinota bacterium]
MSQVLSQGEVDALLKGVGSNQITSQSDLPDEVRGVVPYDLTSQEKIIRG